MRNVQEVTETMATEQIVIVQETNYASLQVHL